MEEKCIQDGEQINKLNIEQPSLLQEILNEQMRQSKLLQELGSRLTGILIFVLFILLFTSCSGVLIYERMGQMRLY